jgi:ferric-dicitrate binding protein FerR (iron transport regulator)
MPGTASPTISHASLEQAAQWYVRLNDQPVGEQERQCWQAWLAQSGEHQAAWRYVERVGQRFAALHNDHPQAAGVVLRTTARAPITRRQTVKSLLILASGGLLGWNAWHQTSLPDALDCSEAIPRIEENSPSALGISAHHALHFDQRGSQRIHVHRTQRQADRMRYVG